MPAIKAVQSRLVAPTSATGLACRGAAAAAGSVTASIGWAGLKLEIEIPILAEAIAERIHPGNFLPVSTCRRKTDTAAEEGLRQAPQDQIKLDICPATTAARASSRAESLAQNVDALRLEIVEMVHRGGRKLSVGQNVGHG